MIVTLDLSTGRLRRLLSDANVELSDDVVLRLTSDTLAHRLQLEVVDVEAETNRLHGSRETVAVKNGYL